MSAAGSGLPDSEYTLPAALEDAFAEAEKS